MISQAQEHLEQFQEKLPELEILNPMTGEVIGTVPNSTREMVAAAVERARAAQPAWSAVPVKERCKILKRFSDLVMQNQERLVQVIRQENGKFRGGAVAETLGVSLVTDYYCKHAANWLKPEKRSPLARGLYAARVYHKPLGVAGNISPWNYPFFLSHIDMIPALIAGNVVVVKPSEITPYSCMEGAKLMREAGLPENVFQVVTGDGQTGDALIDYVDCIAFTGSTAIGRKVGVRAAHRLIPFSLELGGNDPMIVLRDADIDKAAANAISAGFENTGQACVSIERVLVEAPIYEEFLEAMKKWHAKLKIGVEDSLDVHIGSLTNRRELERTEAHIQDAVAKGARLVVGGKRMSELGPLFHEATIVADLTADMDLMKDETFGCLIGVTSVKDADEAIRVANSTSYGLSGSVWSRDIRKAEQVATQLDCGDVSINAAFLAWGTPSVEMGGQRDSGLGRRGGKQGLFKYTAPQSIVIDRFPMTPDAPTLYTNKILTLLKLNRVLGKIFPFLAP